MRTALIMMTILGCDDTASHCELVRTLPQRWTSIELCDAASEREMARLQGIEYPMLVAVCQIPDLPASPETATSPALEDLGPVLPAPASAEEEEGLAARALERVKNVLPSIEGLRDLAAKPIRLMTESYSWVARKVAE